jgi:hypothetical protein
MLGRVMPSDAPSDAPRDDPDAPTREAPLEETDGDETVAVDPRWWGETRLEVGQVARLVAGPLRLWAERRAHEWRLVSEHGADGHAGAAERGHLVDQGDVPEGAAGQRFSFASAPAAFIVRPALADRPVVVRPDGVIAIPSGERVTLYVSTPVWLVLSVGRPSSGPKQRGGSRRAPPARERNATDDVRLTELPSYRLSDTWFGPSTREGELCYASRTAGRLTLDELPRRPHRAVTPVTIHNHAAQPLVIDRVQVPIPLLSLYVDADDALWTNGVNLTRESDGDHAALRVEPSPPRTRRGAPERLAPPRTTSSGSAVVRAFSRLFRGSEVAP